MNKTDLMIIPENHPILPDSDTLSVILDEVKSLGGSQFPCARARIASVGSTRFSVVEVGDSADNASDPKELVGVIAAAQNRNMYWSTPVGAGEKRAPDCSSNDGVMGRDTNGNCYNCTNCPRNQYGSGVNGTGKACSNKVALYILREGDPFPLVLTVPPTSIKALRDYRLKLIRLGVPLMGVLSTMTLTMQQRGANTVPVLTFADPKLLNDSELARVKEYAVTLQKMAEAGKDIEDPEAAAAEAPKAFVVDEEVPF